jgi:predicted ATPase
LSHIGEALAMIETTKEKWCEAEVYRIAGEIALMSPEPDPAKAEASFERALAVARSQKAKSWELRTAMSLARLWCDQGKRHEARELLAPVFGSFTEGFDTLDLKQAKALLDELAYGVACGCEGSMEGQLLALRVISRARNNQIASG